MTTIEKSKEDQRRREKRRQEHGGSAFPVNVHFDAEGMTLLDYYAGKALEGMIGCQDFSNEVCKLVGPRTEAREMFAMLAFDQAEAMIAEKRRREGGESA